MTQAARPACYLAALLMIAGMPAALSAQTSVTAMPSVPASKTLVIAHRGASALRPEHTLAAYAQAIEDGADAIEPDLVSTKDGFLVARHENEIGGTTDIAARPEFAARKARKTIDGEGISGWFTEDFTLAELKTLRARERLPQLRSTGYDGQFQIVTLDEMIELVATESARRGRLIGLVPEIKHPTYFAGLGLSMEDTLLATLAAREYTRRAPVTIQSFETANLRYLRERLGDAHPNIRLLQLLGDKGQRPYDAINARQHTSYGQMLKPRGLREIAGYADAIGPSAKLLDLRIDDGNPRSELVEAAHEAGLQVIVYTFCPENYFLGSAYKGDGGDGARNEAGSVREMQAYIAAGIDALFTDDPALGRRAVDGM